MEDVRIGRQSQGHIYPLQATTTPVEICPANPHRTGLYFGPPGIASGSGAWITYSTDPAAVLGQGINVANFSAGIVMTIADMGNQITKAWFAQISAGTAGCCVMENSLGVE
jgi:hypothetical protein